MSDVIQRIIPANETKNGSMVVGAKETGEFDKAAPDFNYLPQPSGKTFQVLDPRFKPDSY